MTTYLSHSLKLYLEEQNYVVETIGDGEDVTRCVVFLTMPSFLTGTFRV
ncbi:MAG: hypothetical protein IPM93_25080 [Candidatus Obscuribacter sp.]|nr:hypothetical protein [Candidatus Obscuribacter sp.]